MEGGSRSEDVGGEAMLAASRFQIADFRLGRLAADRRTEDAGAGHFSCLTAVCRGRYMARRPWPRLRTGFPGRGLFHPARQRCGSRGR